MLSLAGVTGPILLVDDERQILLSHRLVLTRAGAPQVITLEESREVLPLLERQPVAMVVMDLAMPHLSGQELLPQLVSRHPQVPVVILTGDQDVGTAVACMRAGAADYLVKPVEPQRFLATLSNVLRMEGLKQELAAVKEHLLSGQLRHPEAFAHMVGTGRVMVGIFQYLEAVAPSNQPLLITGETGVGKELAAQAYHRLAAPKGPFVAENVAGLEDSLFADALFGHVRGAFTGADRERSGLAARASGGVLFLDEIGDLSSASQVKLLRLIQEGSFTPVGSDHPQRFEGRLVVATNRDLGQEMAAGRFRADLFYRLSAHRVHIPPLRERLEEMPSLLDHFLAEACGVMAKRVPPYPADLLDLLRVHPYPGNVRELRAMVYDAVARHQEGKRLALEVFRQRIHEAPGLSRLLATPLPVGGGTGGRGASPAVPAVGGGGPAEGARGDGLFISGSRGFPTLKEAELALVTAAMSRTGNNQGVAASLLGITRQALNRRLRLGQGEG